MSKETERYVVDMVALKHLLGFDHVPMSSCSIRIARNGEEEILPGNAQFVLIVPTQEANQ